MRLINLFINTILLLSVACNSSTDDLIEKQTTTIDKKTRIFSRYIGDQFQLSISDEVHYYILVPKMGCSGCMDKTLLEINKIITPENKNKFTFITTNRRKIPEELLLKIELYDDKSNKLDILSLNIVNVTIIKTLNSKVDLIKNINLEDIDSISKIVDI